MISIYSYFSVYYARDKFFSYFFLVKKNHYVPVSQANWCNMTFTAGNLFPSH